MIPRLKHFLNRLSLKFEIRSIIFLEVAAGIFLSFLLLLLFLFISDAVLDHQTIYLDNMISQYINTFRQPWLTRVMFSISLLGEQILIIQAIFVVILLTTRRHKKETLVFSILLVIGLVVTNLLKVSFKIPRPEEFALIKMNSYSFPSGHSLNSFLFYGTLSYYTYHLTRNKIISFFVSLISLCLVFLIGISRVYLGVHRPSDVVAGYIAGFWLLATVVLIDKTIEYYKFVKEPNNP